MTNIIYQWEIMTGNANLGYIDINSNWLDHYKTVANKSTTQVCWYLNRTRRHPRMRRLLAFSTLCIIEQIR